MMDLVGKTQTCAASCCGATVKQGRAFCRPCWSQLPAQVQGQLATAQRKARTGGTPALAYFLFLRAEARRRLEKL